MSGVMPSNRTMFTPPMWADAHVSVIFWCRMSVDMTERLNPTDTQTLTVSLSLNTCKISFHVQKQSSIQFHAKDCNCLPKSGIDADVRSLTQLPQINRNEIIKSAASPFIFSFRVKLPWIFFSSASMVRPPMSASRWVRFTMPMPNTINVTCWGSELTKLRRRTLAPMGLLGVADSCCSFSKNTLQRGSEGRRPASGKKMNKIEEKTFWLSHPL